MTFSLSYGDYTFGDEVRITRLEGLGAPDMRFSQENKPFEDGGILYSTYYAPRNITIEGYISSTSIDTFFALRSELLTAFKSNTNSKTLSITTWSETAYTRTISARVLKSPMFVDQTSNGVSKVGYRIELFCGQIGWLGTTKSGTLYLPNVTGFSLPLDLPFDITSSGTSTVTVTNSGDYNAIPTITITAGDTLTNPTISNNTTGESIRISTTITGGDTITITKTTQGVSVLYNGSTNYYQYFSGDFFEIEPGNNTLQFSAGTYDASTTCVISFKDTYLSL